MSLITHQYIERQTGKVRTERLFADRLVNFLYSEIRESVPAVFKALISARASSLLGFLNFDLFLSTKTGSTRQLLHSWGVDVSECLDPPEYLDTPEKLFTRKLRYWECRPMPPDPKVVVSPCEARVLLGSFRETSLLYVKDKFFDFQDLLGQDRAGWLEAFTQGDFAVFRLTPDKYHYNHTPVSGLVKDVYRLDGDYHSCNPTAVISLVTPYSKNTRTVTVLDTDVNGGSGVGLVAMIEVVALMVGRIEQCYSPVEYQNPRPVEPGQFVEKGRPKSLFRPGSSTVVLVFQKDRVVFDEDLLDNQRALGVMSRFSQGFGQPLVETEVRVRSGIGAAAPDG